MWILGSLAVVVGLAAGMAVELGIGWLAGGIWLVSKTGPIAGILAMFFVTSVLGGLIDRVRNAGCTDKAILLSPITLVRAIIRRLTVPDDGLVWVASGLMSIGCVVTAVSLILLDIQLLKVINQYPPHSPQDGFGVMAVFGFVLTIAGQVALGIIAIHDTCAFCFHGGKGSVAKAILESETGKSVRKYVSNNIRHILMLLAISSIACPICNFSLQAGIKYKQAEKAGYEAGLEHKPREVNPYFEKIKIEDTVLNRWNRDAWLEGYYKGKVESLLK